MKVYISKYRNHWYSPYTWIDYAFFWTEWSKCGRKNGIPTEDELEAYVSPPDWVEVWAERLSPISRAIQWVLDRVHPPIQYIKIDRWDTWSMDHTLAHIVLPMLKQLKRDKHGAPHVDDDDVPEELRSTAAPAKQNEWDIDNNHFRRWDWVMDEMIFAFEKKCQDDWSSEFHSGESDIVWTPVDRDGNVVDKKDAKFFRMDDGPKHTHKIDMEGMQKVQARISNGFRLFGKYYEGLWD